MSTRSWAGRKICSIKSATWIVKLYWNIVMKPVIGAAFSILILMIWVFSNSFSFLPTAGFFLPRRGTTNHSPYCPVGQNWTLWNIFFFKFLKKKMQWRQICIIMWLRWTMEGCLYQHHLWTLTSYLLKKREERTGESGQKGDIFIFVWSSTHVVNRNFIFIWTYCLFEWARDLGCAKE